MIVLLTAALLAAPIFPPSFDADRGGDDAPQIAIAPLAAPPGIPGPPDDDDDDGLQEALFPPDFIVEHQKDIALEEKQRNAIIDEIARAQGDVVRSRWKLQAATGDLKTLLGADKIEESKALAKADEVMSLERDVKRTNLVMLIRIKNLLTAEQRAKLDKLREEDDPMRHFRVEMRHMREQMKHPRFDRDDDGMPPVPPAPPAPPAPPKGR